MSLIKKWIPYTLPWDDMPVDLSCVYKADKPAGKRGFLTVKGNQFRFEDGTPGRFWGTNFNSAANFPEHDHSRKVARRLAKIGVNIVRFHQLDAEWSTPNIFQFTKGPCHNDTLTLDPESMDRLDFLVDCLKKEGIYVYLDLLTYRLFKPGDGVARTDKLSQAARPYTNYDRRLIELQKKFNEDLWNHYNPYTKLAYKDDPVFAFTEIVNENDLFCQSDNELDAPLEPYRSDLEKLYRAWAGEKGLALGAGPVVFDRKDDNVFRFYGDLQKAYYREMLAHLRSIGVRIPVAGTNWMMDALHLECQTECDFTDSHAYHYQFGRWTPTEKRFLNETMMERHCAMPNYLAFSRVFDKPYFVSEWDNPWPNEWRADTSLFLAAVGAFQGWGGYCIHTYRYDTDESTTMIGRPITSETLGGVAYRGGVFDSFNDPARFGLFYHAALIMRRGDVAPARTEVAVKLENGRARNSKAFAAASEVHGIGSLLPGRKDSARKTVNNTDELIAEQAGEVTSDTGELYRSWKKGLGWINTPMTKAVYGLVGGQGEIQLGAVGVTVATDFATVAISSLTEQPIEESTNLLLTAVGRSDNTDARYEEESGIPRQRIQKDPGHGPILVEVIYADIAIRTARPNLRVRAINPRGFYIGDLPSEYKDGVFRFSLGGVSASMYYLIQTV